MNVSGCIPRVYGIGKGLRAAAVAAALLFVCLPVCASAASAEPPVRLRDLLPARVLRVLPAPPAIDPDTTDVHGDIQIPCEACHTAQAWTPLRDDIDFDHSEQTRFAMTGKHALAECASCHLDLRFDRPDLTADDCASCHLDVHRGQLGDECQTCHNTQDFQLTNGALIHAQTTFPLTGSHLQVSC